MEFKVKDEVKVIGNECDSINKIGDVGTVVEVDLRDPSCYSYRVYVKGRKYNSEENIANWHGGDELELLERKIKN